MHKISIHVCNKKIWKCQRILKTRQIWGIWKLRPAYSLEMPNLGQNRWCFVPCDPEIGWMTLENNRASFLCCFKFGQHFIAIGEIKLELQSGNAQFGSNLTIFRAVWPWNLTDDLEQGKSEGFDSCDQPRNLKLDSNRQFFRPWPCKTIGHLFYATSSFVHHFVAIGEFKLELQSGNTQSGSNSTIFRAVRPWNLTDDLAKQ